MKNNLFALYSLLLICLVSCKKKETNTDKTYQLYDIKEVVLENNESIDWVIPVKFNGSSQEKVTVSIDSLPENVTVQLDSISGYPPFNAVFRISAKYAIPYVYYLSLQASNESGKVEQHVVKLIIKPTTKLCLDDFVENYHQTQTIFKGTTYPKLGFYYAQISHYGTDQLMISCNCNFEYTAVANVYCDQALVRIPLQRVGVGSQYTMVGTGTISKDGTVTLNYSLHNLNTKITEKYTDILK
jgi:hypothetical protein